MNARSATAVRARSCPRWCIEHYTGDDGTEVCAGRPRSVTGEDAGDGKAVTVATWVELRAGVDDVEAVGIVEKVTKADAELSASALRRLAGHLVAVAELVDAANGVRSVRRAS